MRGCIIVALVCVATPVSAAPEQEIFALIVASNRSANLQRPDLQYADDDGARYAVLFRSVTSAENVVLVTRFDHVSAGLYGQLTSEASPPRRQDVNGAISRISAAIEKARSAGHRAVFYFVYAGHGDVRGGKGFLELEDGVLDADFLEKEIIDGIKADEHHIVLDSCNSFFVVNPRKPGGRRFATPKDLTEGFARKHPNVGLLLSTNAEADVYEWSELESGIFSHELRSALSGAADVNRDGKITYDEVAAFIETANRRIDNNNYRPRILARGPGQRGDAVLFETKVLRGRRMALPEGQLRLWIRDERGVRLLDIHKEQSGSIELVIPDAGDRPFVVYERTRNTRDPAQRPTLYEYRVPGGREIVVFASLKARSVSSQPRGPDAIFSSLFAEPFGPSAFSHYRKMPLADEAVFGITRQDEFRMRNYLQAIAEQEKSTRHTWGVFLATIGLPMGLIGLAVESDSDRLTFGLLGGSLLLSGALLYTVPWSGEQAYAHFEREIKTSRDRDLIVARTERYLDSVAARERTFRRIGQIICWSTVTLDAGLLLHHASADLQQGQSFIGAKGYLLIGGMGLLSAALAWELGRDTPTERFVRLYRQDPDLHLSIGLAPLPGGVALGVAGRFH